MDNYTIIKVFLLKDKKMIIATLIISCLTLIAVSVGLFLNFKSNRNTLLAIANFEEAINKNVGDAKNEILTKLQDANNSTNSKLDTSKTEIQNESDSEETKSREAHSN